MGLLEGKRLVASHDPLRVHPLRRIGKLQMGGKTYRAIFRGGKMYHRGASSKLWVFLATDLAISVGLASV